MNFHTLQAVSRLQQHQQNTINGRHVFIISCTASQHSKESINATLFQYLTMVSLNTMHHI